MEQLPLSAVQDDLNSRSKKALIRGILSVAIPSGIILIGYILFMFFFVSAAIQAKEQASSEFPVPMIISILVFLLCLLAGSLVMMILGKSAWNQAKSVRKSAVDANTRRPASSIVAHVFGIMSFIQGLILTIILVLYLFIFALIVAFTGIGMSIL